MIGLELFFDAAYEANAFVHPTRSGVLMLNVPRLWLNTSEELRDNQEIPLDLIQFFAYRISETFLHELLHYLHGLNNEQILLATGWIREWLVYDSWPLV